MSNILLSIDSVASAAPGIDETPKVARITIDRAARSNALSRPMLDELLDAIRSISSDARPGVDR